jgi:large subunit ribosomal protein L25
VAGERVRLEVQERESSGTRASRRLRRQGLIPGVLYGGGQKPHPISIPERTLRSALTGGAGLHAILDVVLDGHSSARPAILKDYQQDPLRGRVIHIDLQVVRLDRPIQAQLVVQLVGEPVGVKEGGVLSQPVRELNVEALPMEIPEHLDVDVSAMHIGDTLRLADIPVVEKVAFLDNPDETVLATVTMPTRVVEPEPEEEEGVEGEEAAEAEGEAPAEQPEGAAEQQPEAGGDASGSAGTDEG